MRGDLKNGIDGGVDDGLSRGHMRLAELLHDRNAGGVALPEHARQMRARDQIRDQRGGKGGYGARKKPERRRSRRARHFPMAGRRILAPRRLHRHAIDRLAPHRTRQARRRRAGRTRAGAPQPERIEMRQAQRPRAGGGIRATGRASLRDMAERIGAFVAKGGRIRRAAAAHRIENDEERARHAYCATAAASTASMLKAAANRARVYSLRGLPKISCAGPCSTTTPWRMTSTSVASAFTTFRSWLMNI